MQSIRRRRLLQLTMAFSGVAIAGCGGGANADTAPTPGAGTSPPPGATPNPSPGPSPNPPPPPPNNPSPPAPNPSPAPPPAPAPVGAKRLSLTSASTSSLAPFCAGFAFRKGDIPAGSVALPSVATVQVTPKNYWPDGSLKFALVAGRVNLTSGVSQSIDFSPATGSAATSLTLSALKATGVTASIGCGAFGSAAWSSADWDSPFVTWVSGPEMSSWIYRKPVGSDAHLVAWLEVRLYAGGAVEILPWIENGYLKVAGAQSKSATFTFALSGSQRFSQAIDLACHCRTVLVSGSALSHWLATDPQVTVKHDTTYLQSTALVPSYRATVSPSAAAVQSLVSTFAPLQQGNMPNAMGSAGYHPSIGLLPEWDVLYLTSTAQAAYKAVQFNAYSLGRYGIHFRDETTNRPIRFSQYPNLCLVQGSSDNVASKGQSSTDEYTAASTGPTFPQSWEGTHHPSAGFLAYLVSGRWYFMEEVQFGATLHYLKQGNVQRQGSSGVLKSNVGACTTRGMAWSVRTLFQAACATPDDDTSLRTELLACVKANIDYYHARYVAQTNNPFGWVTPYTDYTGADGVFMGSPWQQDFVTAAFGYGLALEVADSDATRTKLTEFFHWKARSAVGRLGTSASTDFLYRDAAPYTVAVAPTDNPNFDNGSGPWYSSWGATYDATYSSSSPGTRIDGTLRGGNFPGSTSYWGNMQPAIAYAVQHGVPGATAAYGRMRGASNWAEVVTEMNSTPVWGVKPLGE